MYEVHGEAGVDPTDPPRGPFPFAPIPHAPEMAAIVRALAGQGLHPVPLPLGLRRPGEPDGCILCETCNSFPCRIHAKSDAEVCAMRPALRSANVELWTERARAAPLTDPSGRRVESIDVERRGETVRVGASLVVVVVWRDRTRRRCCSSRRATSTRPVSPTRPISSAAATWRTWRRCWKGFIRCDGTTRSSRRRWHSTTSTGAAQTCRIRSGTSSHRAARTASWRRSSATSGIPGFPWRPTAGGLRTAPTGSRCPRTCRVRTIASPSMARAACISATCRTTPKRTGGSSPRRRGCSTGSAPGRSCQRHSHGSQNTTHQCGTLCFGADPRTSVLDPFCRTHDVCGNLFVVDASFFPSSAAVNPRGLTIIRRRRCGRRITSSAPPTSRQGVSREGAIVQSRRHHGVELQHGSPVLRGRLRLPAGGCQRRRPTVCGRSSRSALTHRRRPAKIGWIRVPGGATLEIFEFQAAVAHRRRFPGTGSG